MEEFLLCNFIEIILLHGWSLVNLLGFCRIIFLNNTYGGLPLTFTLYKKHTVCCFLSLSTVIIHQFHSCTKNLTLIPFIPTPSSPHFHPDFPHPSHSRPDSHHSKLDSPHSHLDSSHSHPYCYHCHPDSHHPHSGSPQSHSNHRIPRIPTIIPHTPTMIPRIPIIPFILLPDSPFRLLQIVFQMVGGWLKLAFT